MGWSSGSELAEEIWILFHEFAKDKVSQVLLTEFFNTVTSSEEYKQMSRKFIDIFEDMDCDTMEDTTAYRIAYPEKFDEKGEWIYEEE